MPNALIMDTVKQLGMHLIAVDMDEEDETVVRQGPVEVILVYIRSAHNPTSLLEEHYVLVLQQSIASRIDCSFMGSKNFHPIPKPQDLHKRIGIGMEAIGIEAIFTTSPGASGRVNNQRAEGVLVKYSWAPWEHETMNMI